MIILDFHINYFLLFVVLSFILLLKFIYDYKHLNLANNSKIHEAILSRNHSPCFVIQMNWQKLYFSSQMHALQEETCNLSKKSFRNYSALVCLTVLGVAVDMSKNVSSEVVI